MSQSADIIPFPRAPKPTLTELMLAMKFLGLCRVALSVDMTDEQIIERFRQSGVTEDMLKAVWRVLDRWQAVP